MNAQIIPFPAARIVRLPTVELPSHKAPGVLIGLACELALIFSGSEPVDDDRQVDVV